MIIINNSKHSTLINNTLANIFQNKKKLGRQDSKTVHLYECIQCRMFAEYCPIPLFANVLIVFAVVSNRDEGESCSPRRYCTSVQFIACTVTQLWFVYYNSKQSSSENVLNLRIGQYLQNSLYLYVYLYLYLYPVPYLSRG